MTMPADISTASPAGYHKTADIADKLPERAAAKLKRFRTLAGDLHAAFIARDLPIEEITHRLRARQTTLAQLRGAPSPQRRIRRSELFRDDEGNEKRREIELVQSVDAVAEVQAEIDGLEAERKKLREARDVIGKEAQAWRAIATRCERWLEDMPRGLEITEAKELPKVAANAKLDSVRDQIGALREELEQVRRAPLPSGEVKARLAAQIDALAENRPDVFEAIEGGAPIRWPDIEVTIHGGTGDGRSVLSHGRQIDVIGLFAWLHRDALVTALEREVDALADDGAALSREERAEREAQILADILLAGRCEEAICERMEANGGNIARRPDADPRAVLGLSGDLPAPSEA